MRNVRPSRACEKTTRHSIPLAIGVAILMGAATVNAAIITLTSTGDTTLRQDQTGDNFGSYNQMWVGRSGGSSNLVRRGLLEFDLSSIPAGATINSASLKITVSATHSISSSFGLYRALKDWGEGVKSGKSGAAATAGEASWTNRLTGTAAWGAAGGQSGTDYQAAASASVTIGGTGSFNFNSTNLLNDVKNMRITPATNFGWFLICGSEGSVAQSVTKFHTKEATTASNRPTLTIDYSVPEPAGILLLVGGCFVLFNRARRGRPVVESPA